ncbi:hydrolase [Xylariales sp. PMI_506]|nr:hydrolase [Xylariales sp. PMI_506]
MAASNPINPTTGGTSIDNLQKSKGNYSEWIDRKDVFKARDFPEHIVDLGEIRMNYAVAGSPEHPALLLIPGQTQSWWTYVPTMRLLAESYQVYAVDLRGQGRSTWTPGRYSIDLFGNDLVHFIDRVIGRPVIVSGLSSGGVVTAWLSAFALPGQILAAVYEDPPLFASETEPAYGHSVHQTFVGPLFRIWTKWLGPQWSVGNVSGMAAAMEKELPGWLKEALSKLEDKPIDYGDDKEPDLTNLCEYDPEWAQAFWTGAATLNCDHEAMLQQVKVPVLFTHHSRIIEPEAGNLIGAISDLQVRQVQRLVEGTGNSFTLRSFPEQPHSMHGNDPALFVTTITEWIAGLGLGPALHPTSVAPLSGQQGLL